MWETISQREDDNRLYMYTFLQYIVRCSLAAFRIESLRWKKTFWRGKFLQMLASIYLFKLILQQSKSMLRGRYQLFYYLQ